MKNIIRTENLDVGYDKKTVIEQVDIQAVKGQVICLLGPNGAGKSTILRTLSGLLAPVHGGVYLDGTDIRKIKKKEMAKKLSLVLTESVAPSLTTVYELVSMGRAPYTNFMGRLSDEDRTIIREALETVGAETLSERYYSELSDGEKQKVMIARALVQEPELIILDEPTSHLDIRHKVEVIRVLQKLSNEKGITCILSLHDIDLALKGCQTVLLVNNGKVVASGSPEEVVHSGMIQQLYGIQGAEYNELLGAVELKGSQKNDVFVTGGNYSGINIYRALARKGLGITAGVLHKNDADCTVAESICQRVVCEEPFEKISSRRLEEAYRLASKAFAVVDSGFLVGSGNMGNLELIKKAAENAKYVISMRNTEEGKQLYGALSQKIHYVSDIAQLYGELQAAGGTQ